MAQLKTMYYSLIQAHFIHSLAVSYIVLVVLGALYKMAATASLSVNESLFQGSPQFHPYPLDRSQLCSHRILTSEIAAQG